MANIKDLENYLYYEFSSGCTTGSDYKIFQTKYINYLKGLCINNDWQLVNIGKNHYEFSTFVKNDKGAFLYISISDVRYWKNEWYNHILIRTATHERDYTGGYNQYTTLCDLENKIKRIFGGAR